jgi:hypothetical protein
MPNHAKRVSVIVVERNGNGNYLRQWSGHWFDAGDGTFEEKKRAAIQSLSDALERKSPVRENEQTYPHPD